MLLLSGVWPYLKLLIMMTCWCSSTNFISVRKREKILMWLNALGKWSLLDIYVLAMMMVAFRYHVDGAVSSPVDGQEHTFSFDLYVEPKWGFYGFMLATFQSLFMSHVMLALHRRAIGTPVPIEIRGKQRAVANKRFDVGAKGLFFHTTRLGRVAAVVCLIGAMLFVGFGTNNDSFTFKFEGEGQGSIRFCVCCAGTVMDAPRRLASHHQPPATANGRTARAKLVCTATLLFWMAARCLLLSCRLTFPRSALLMMMPLHSPGLAGLLLGNDTDVTMSVVSLGEFLPDSVRGNIRGNVGFGIGLIQAVIYLFVIFVPLLVLFLLLVLWIVPMSSKWQRRFYNAAEVTAAWDTLDVFVVSLLACVLQIKQFAVFLIGDNCNVIEDLLAGFGDPNAPKLKCFDVATSLQPGSFMLVFGWIFSAAVGWIIMRVAHAVVYPADKGRSDNRKKMGYTGSNGITPDVIHPIIRGESCCAPHFAVRESDRVDDGMGQYDHADNYPSPYRQRGGSGVSRGGRADADPFKSAGSHAKSLSNARPKSRPRSTAPMVSPRTSPRASPRPPSALRKASPDASTTAAERTPLAKVQTNPQVE